MLIKIKALGLALCLALIGMAFNVQSAIAAPGFQEVSGETCPQGYIYVTVDEAVKNRSEICSTLTEWSIARLADGGSMDGPGYDCKVRGEDSRQLGNAVCKQLNATITNKDGYCPDGYTLATYSDAVSNQDTLCNNPQVGPWHIMRLHDSGSMDGPGYGCKIRPEDTRALGNSICVESL